MPPVEPAHEPGANETLQRLVVLLSHERSGSHYLADLLKSTSELVSADEVCNFSAVDPNRSRLSFFRFRREYAAANLELDYSPDAEVLTRFLDAYFLHLLDRMKGRSVLVDVKYAHVHNFEIGWWPTVNRPFLARYLEKRNVRILHLTRADSLAAITSSHIAEGTSVWHKRSGEQDRPAPAKLRVPCQSIVHNAMALEAQKATFFGWLAGNRCFHLVYENLCRSDDAQNLTMREVCGFLGLAHEGVGLSSSYLKMTPALQDVVANYDELRRVAGLFGQGRLLHFLKSPTAADWGGQSGS